MISDTLLVLSGLLVIMVFIIMVWYMSGKAAKEKRSKEELKKELNELEEAYQGAGADLKQLSLKYEELRKSEERSRKLAYTDHLTGLPNQTAFLEMLDNVMLTLRKEEFIALVYIDLDDFKHVNDKLGHSYGDELLIDVTERMKQVLEENDYMARYGSDEFVILTQNIEDIGLYEEKVKKMEKVFSYPFVLAMQEFFVTTSIGITFGPRDGKTTQALVKCADQAMYAAKEMGKNMYCYYDESMNNRLMERIEMQSELREAIEMEQFTVYFQPWVSLSDNRVAGFETLLRWEHPQKGMLRPESFLKLAEETGLILPIGRFVLNQACVFLKQWKESGRPGIKVSVNLSVRQLMEDGLLSAIKEEAANNGISPGDFEVEIQEAAALENMDSVLEMIEKLEQMGVGTALDHFRMGYSSMNCLKYLPIHSIKLDPVFQEGINGQETGRIMICAIISMAKALHMPVTAVGVETGEYAAFLKEAECDYMQGFFYSQPLPLEEACKINVHWEGL